MSGNPLDLVLLKLRRKLWLENVLHWLISGLLVTAGMLFVFVVSAHLYPLLYVPGKALYAGGALMALALAAGLLKRPDLKQAAAAGDRLGLEERLTTYLEYRNREFALGEAFREEAEYAVQNINPLSRYKLSINGKKILAAAILIILAWGIYFLPSETRQAAGEREEINRELQKEAGKIKKIREELPETKDDRENNEQLLSVLKTLERRLSRAGDFDLAAAEVADAQKKLGRSVASQDEIMQSLAGIFEGTGSGHQVLREALRSGDLEKAVKLSAESQFTDSERKTMLDNLQEAAGAASSPELKSELARLKTALEDNALSGEKLQEALRAVADTGKLFAPEEKVALELQQSKERLLARTNGGINSPGGGDRLAAFAAGETSDYSRAETTGSSGGDLAAGGPGGHHTGSSHGVGGGGNKASGEGNGEGLTGELARREQATRLGEEGAPLSRVQGQLGTEGGMVDKAADRVPTETGELSTPDRVRAEFGEADMEYVLKYPIPLPRRELVMEYFTLLNGGN